MTSTATGRVDPVSPDEIRALAARVDELVRDLAAAGEKMRAVDDATRDSTFRFEDTLDDLRRAAGSLVDTAVDLDRIYGRPPCPTAWGICPRDGRTLVEANGGTDCTGDCGVHWDYLKLSTACREPVEYEVRHPDGTTEQMCLGHAKDAEDQRGATLTDLADLTDPD